MAVITNASRGVFISDKAQVTVSFSEKLLGLLNPKNSRYLIVNTRFGIHTFFLKTPIDVVVVNESFEVVKIKSSLKPNNFFFYNSKYSTVIEMPKGSIKKYQIKINDKISINDSGKKK